MRKLLLATAFALLLPVAALAHAGGGGFGGGHMGGSFGGGHMGAPGFNGHSFGSHGFGGRFDHHGRFFGRGRFIGGVWYPFYGYGYGYGDDYSNCWVWTPAGYQWACGDYGYGY